MTAYSADALISSAAYLASQTKPQFATGHHLPHLSRYGYEISSNLCVELAANWGYALPMGDGSWVDFKAALQNTNSRQWAFIRLATNDPSRYVLSVGMNQRLMKPIPDDFYVTNSSGWFVGAYATNTWQYATNPAYAKIISPEGNESYWSNSAEYWVAPLAAIRSNAPIAIVLNPGEYGLNVFFGGYSQAWAEDPRVQESLKRPPWNKYTGGDGSFSSSWLLWFNYGSFRRAQQYQYTTDAVRRLLPDRELYIHYDTDGESYRSLNIGGTNWASGWHYNSLYTRSLSDYANFETYYRHFNTGFTGSQDMLTKYLNAVGGHMTYGSSTNYSWVCGGFTRGTTNDFANIETYTGYLKCCYTAGMVGAVAGYFSAFTDSAFPSNTPPQWLLQMTALSHVHALFSHLEGFIRNGDLLPGPNMHSASRDQPAYELPTGDPTARVLSRKLRGSNQWLVTAWAADGPDRTVQVQIPNLGTLRYFATPSASVYYVTLVDGSTRMSLLDEYSPFPFKPAPPSNPKVLPQ